MRAPGERLRCARASLLPSPGSHFLRPRRSWMHGAAAELAERRGSHLPVTEPLAREYRVSGARRSYMLVIFAAAFPWFVCGRNTRRVSIATRTMPFTKSLWSEFV